MRQFARVGTRRHPHRLQRFLYAEPYRRGAEDQERWSLHLDVDVRDHRLPQGINLGLYPLATKWGDKKRVSKCFYEIAKGKNHTDLVTDLVKRLIDDGQGETAWAVCEGLYEEWRTPITSRNRSRCSRITRKTFAGATQARLHMIIDGQLLKFSRMRPAAGAMAVRSGTASGHRPRPEIRPPHPYASILSFCFLAVWRG